MGFQLLFMCWKLLSTAPLWSTYINRTIKHIPVRHAIYFFETSHEHFVSSIGRRWSEIFDCSIKGDRHISRSSEAAYGCKTVNSQKWWRADSLSVHLATDVVNSFRIYMFTYCDYNRHSNIPFQRDVFDVMEEQARQRSGEHAWHNTINTKLPTNFGFS